MCAYTRLCDDGSDIVGRSPRNVSSNRHSLPHPRPRTRGGERGPDEFGGPAPATRNVRRDKDYSRCGRSWLGVAVLLLATCCAGLTGCKSTVDNTDIKDTYGPIGRFAKNRVETAKREASGDPYVGLEELNAARKLYDEQKYLEARKAFHKIVKNKKWKNEPVVEEALFYRAETDFQLGHYPSAQDGYDELLKNHPATKYLETSVKRLYAIAKYWALSVLATKPASPKSNWPEASLR